MEGLDEDDRARLDALQAAGLFVELDAEKIDELYHGVSSSAGDDFLGELIDLFFDEPSREIWVMSPIKSAVLVERIPELAAHVRDEPQIGKIYIHVRGSEESIFESGGFDENVAVFNLVLERAGDPRRFVSMYTSDRSEPRYLLVTPDQEAALAEADLVVTPSDELELPRDLGDTRAREVVEELASRGATASVTDDGRIELAFDLERARALIVRLREQAYERQRTYNLVNRANGKVP